MVEDTDVLIDVEDVEAASSCICGFGHTLSRTASGQYSAMVLYRYHCRSTAKPAGITGSGRLDASGDQVGFFSNTIICSSLSDDVL